MQKANWQKQNICFKYVNIYKKYLFIKLQWYKKFKNTLMIIITTGHHQIIVIMRNKTKIVFNLFLK